MNFTGKTLHYAPDKSPTDHLQKAARTYATALRSSPKDGHIHLALGMVLEEMFYAQDLFGLAPEKAVMEGEGEAECSSKEEEFLAICKLHGVAPSAPIAVQLKAAEAEYQSLKEAGQTHKADHVQSLYAWKSKKVLEVCIYISAYSGLIIVMYNESSTCSSIALVWRNRPFTIKGSKGSD